MFPAEQHHRANAIDDTPIFWESEIGLAENYDLDALFLAAICSCREVVVAGRVIDCMQLRQEAHENRNQPLFIVSI
jgi:hypothetical protein